MLRQPSGAVALGRVRGRPTAVVEYLATVDSLGLATVRVPRALSVVEVIGIGYNIATVPLDLRLGYVDTVLVTMRPYCQGS